MNPNDNHSEKNYIRVHKTAILVVALILLVGALGWKLGRSDSPNKATTSPSSSAPTQSTANNTAEVSSLVSFVLPDGWKDARCEGSGSVFVVPNDADPADCNANPIAPVKISVDPANSTDCNQLQNQSEVKKHICISVFINGRKTLKASTEYLASSSYKEATTIDAYYMDTGNGVVKLEYQHTTNNNYQAGFDQLANSLKSKS